MAYELKNVGTVMEKSNGEQEVLVAFEKETAQVLKSSNFARACKNLGCFVVAKALVGGEFVLNLNDFTLCNDYLNKFMAKYNKEYLKNCSDYAKDFYAEEKLFDYVYSKQDYLNAVCVLLGGVCAEELVLGDCCDNLGETYSAIDKILFDMSKNGMFGFNYVFSQERDRIMCYSYEKKNALNLKFDEITSQCFLTAKKIVMDNVDFVKRAMDILSEKQYVVFNELEQMV